jgi:hypothetical protein
MTTTADLLRTLTTCCGAAVNEDEGYASSTFRHVSDS